MLVMWEGMPKSELHGRVPLPITTSYISDDAITSKIGNLAKNPNCVLASCT